MGLEKDMTLEKSHGAGRKGHGAGDKGMALGKRGMARCHAKRGWGKHKVKKRCQSMFVQVKIRF